MLTDIVIPLGVGSFWNNAEIKFCLRSIHKYLENYGKVYLVGQKPDFITNVAHIPYPDESYRKELNIYRKILQACLNGSISETFLFTNDDIFLTSAFKADEFPYFYENTLERIMSRRKTVDSYHRAVKKTFIELSNKKLPNRYFDVHTPILYNKELFVSATNINWATEDYIIKSLYANSVGCPGKLYSDAKLDQMPADFDEYIKDKLMFSTGGGHAMGKKIIPYLEKLYPEKSPWER